MTDLQRRAVMLGTGGVLAAATATATLSGANADTESPRWQPQFEPQDSWLERPHTRHRFVFDTVSAKGAEDGLSFADNFYVANRKSYDLEPDALGVVIILRHMSTPFGYNNAVWAKYGRYFVEELRLEGKQALEGARANPLTVVPAKLPPHGGVATTDSLARKGARFAVCGMATEGIADVIAKKIGSKAHDIHREFVSNLIANAVLVPAGIVALNRAQEHGYAFAYMG